MPLVRRGLTQLAVNFPFESQALREERVALEETGDGIWSLYFYDVLLARLNERDCKVQATIP